MSPLRLYAFAFLLVAFASVASSARSAEHALLTTTTARVDWEWDQHLTDDDGAPAAPEGEIPTVETLGDDARLELAIPARPNAPVGVTRNVAAEREAWGSGVRVRAKIFIPTHWRGPSAQLVARHDVWGWFAVRATRPLAPGEWTTVYWPLDADCAEWSSVNSSIEWNDEIRRRLSLVGLRIFRDTSAASSYEPALDEPVRVRDFAIEGVGREPPPLRISNVRPGRLTPERGRRVELAFDLSRAYDNPYDPERIAVDLDVFAPSGTSITLPAFYYQGFARQRLDDGTEIYFPEGRACWKARFTPTEAGGHSYRLRARDHRGDATETERRAFTVLDAPFKGFLRVDLKDYRYLSFEDGTFYYPISLIVRTPSEQRWKYSYEFEQKPREFALSAYDDYFTSMSAAGLNHTRVWMASWWTALEWSAGYSPYYEGLGRYNQLNAWRLDHVLDLAEREGIYVNLTLHNHGQFSLRTDAEWGGNPYNVAHGGPLESPEDFWVDETSREYVRKRLRYIVARWGHSPAIAMWELVNEVNLTNRYRSHAVIHWHDAMGRRLRELDPYRHIVSTHYTRGKYDAGMMNLPIVEVAQSNCYESDMIDGLMDLFGKYGKHGKPSLINEFGVGMTRPELRHNMHSGLWVSSVMPYCGPALFWWWAYVYEKNEFAQYRALEAFHRGEDYRGRAYWPSRFDVTIAAEGEDGAKTEQAAPEARAVGMRSAKSARLWVYDRRIYETHGRGKRLNTPIARTLAPARVRIPEMAAGVYWVEFWDTWTGKIVASGKVVGQDGAVTVETPAFARDIACKVDWVKETE